MHVDTIYIYISLSLSRHLYIIKTCLHLYIYIQYIHTDIMLHMCIHSYLYRLYLKTIDIPAIPPKFIAHLLTHLLAAVLGHSLEFLLLLRGHPVVLLSFWVNGHTLAWCKGNFAETLLQSSSIYFTIYHLLPSMIFLYTHIISYHWYSRIQFSKPQCTPLFSILSNRTQKGTTWIHLEILRT